MKISQSWRNHAVWFAIGFGVIVVAGSADGTKEVAGEALVLTTKGGLEWARIARLEGQAYVKLCDDSGAARIMLDVGDEATSLLMIDRKNAIRLSLAVKADGTPLIDMRDSNGRQRIELGVAHDGTPYLSLNDSKDNARAMMQAVGGAVTLEFRDEDGRTVWRAGSD